MKKKEIENDISGNRPGNTPFKYNIYGGDKAEHGVGFKVIGKQMKRVMKWKPISERICVLRIWSKFFNYSLINIYAPTSGKSDDVKDAFYKGVHVAYGECPKHDVNAQIGREIFFRPNKESLTNDNGLRLATFAAARSR